MGDHPLPQVASIGDIMRLIWEHSEDLMLILFSWGLLL